MSPSAAGDLAGSRRRRSGRAAAPFARPATSAHDPRAARTRPRSPTRSVRWPKRPWPVILLPASVADPTRPPVGTDPPEPGRADILGAQRHLTRWAAALRVVHPFPSILDGLATFAIGFAAGGPPATALRLGIAMTLLQFAIGAANDLVDAPRELDRADKPLASGAVSSRAASAIAIACGFAGLALAAASGPAVLALAAAGLGVGLAYDLGLKRTPWSWLALAVAIPLLVVFAWYGATGMIDPPLVVLLPAAGFAGASLGLGNALVDPEHDRAAGLRTAAVALGAVAAWRVALVLLLATVAVATTSLAWLGAHLEAVVAAIASGAAAVGGLALMCDRRVGRRERGWELQAVGVASLGAVWVAGVALR